jgi:hypothetical protein
MAPSYGVFQREARLPSEAPFTQARWIAKDYTRRRIEIQGVSGSVDFKVMTLLTVPPYCGIETESRMP